MDNRFKKFIANEKASVLEALAQIDANRQGFIVVTEENGNRYASELRNIKIRLSKRLIKNDRILNNILLHEMIHYYGYFMNEDIEGEHGKFFKKMAKKINKDGYHVTKYYEES